MLGIIYVIFIFLVGKEFLPKTGQSRLWLLLPASFGVGTLAMGWTTYMAAFLVSVCLGQEEPLFWANLIVLAAAFIFLAVIYWRRIRKGSKGLFSGTWVQGEKRKFLREALFFFHSFCSSFLDYVLRVLY